MLTDISYWHTTAKYRKTNELKPFLAGKNTSVLIISATTVYIYYKHTLMKLKLYSGLDIGLGRCQLV